LLAQPEEPKDEEKVSDQLKKLRKSKNPNFSVLEKGKEEEKKSGTGLKGKFLFLRKSLRNVTKVFVKTFAKRNFAEWTRTVRMFSSFQLHENETLVIQL
jgi:hypothetical protein